MCCILAKVLWLAATTD